MSASTVTGTASLSRRIHKRERDAYPARMEFDLSATVELFVSTVEHEDYLMSEKAQKAASARALEYFLFGRNEPALHHFHNNSRAALGEPPLQEYKVA